METTDVCVVGAGVSGLGVAHYLSDTDLNVTVVEESDEVGGVVRSERVDGRVVEHGPQRVRLAGRVEGLVEELTLEDETVTCDETRLYFYHDGRLRIAPLSLKDAVTTDLLSFRGKARILLEPLRSPPRDDETVEEAVSRIFGDEAYRNFLGPLYAGLYASDPARMPARYSLSRALGRFDGSVLVGVALRLLRGGEIPTACTFKDGLQRLPEAIHGGLEDAQDVGVNLGEEVVGIERGGPDDETEDGMEEGELERDGGAPRPPYLVETTERTVGADEVVLTTPPDTTEELLRDVDPDTAERIGKLNQNPLAVVHLVSDAELDGLGHKFTLDSAEGFVTTGVTWNASAFGRDGVYTAYLGGARRHETVEWDAERLGRVAEEEFEGVTGYGAEAVSVSRTAIPAYDTSWEEAEVETLDPPDGIQLCTNYIDRAGIEGRLQHARRVADSIEEGG